MVLKEQVVNAFHVLGLDPATTTVEKATTAYKKLALKHHPDRNYGDPTANERFQAVYTSYSTK
jgi:DnaJ-class molecular chaperone